MKYYSEAIAVVENNNEYSEVKDFIKLRNYFNFFFRMLWICGKKIKLLVQIC